MTDTGTTRSTSAWIKSQKSASNGDCVEMRTHADLVDVRDSKDPEGPTLSLSPAAFAGWLRDAKGGAFDHLA